MGLDMYLSAERYIGDWDHSNADDKATYKRIAEAAGIAGVRCEYSPSLTLKVNVSYWRKANQIHRWFVEKVQKGTDDCNSYHVNREQLEELVKECRAALANKELAREILPTRAGFLFGSTDIDDGYFQDLQDTVDQITAVLKDERFNGFYFSYRSSW